MSKSLVAIVVAIIGALGVLGAALISSSNSSSSPSAINQSSTGSNSPNIAGVQGDVVINPPEPQLKIPVFEGYVDSSSEVISLESFIDSNRGNLVQLNVSIPDRLSSISEPTSYAVATLSISPEPCNEPEFIYCVWYVFTVFGEDHNLFWYKHDNILEGYFIVGENVENHQGVVYSLTSVSRELIAIETQR